MEIKSDLRRPMSAENVDVSIYYTNSRLITNKRVTREFFDL